MVECRSIIDVEAVNRSRPTQDLASGVETRAIVEDIPDVTRDQSLASLSDAAEGERCLLTLSALDRAGVTGELENTHGSLFQR